MRSYHLHIVVFLSSLFSCTDTEVKNEYILEKDKLIDILYHFHVIDASAKQGVISNNRNNLVRHQQYTGILNQFDVDRARFDSTISYYVKQPALMKVIYEKVETRLIEKFESYDSPKSERNREEE